MLDSRPMSEATETGLRDATGSGDARNTMSVLGRVAWAALIAATLYVGYFSHLGAIGFVGPDEPRYAWIARDMAATGDWVTPRLYGKPWFEKPPLYYWGAAAAFKIFGVSETAARLPSALWALLATLGLAWLGWRVHGAESGGAESGGAECGGAECARWLLLLLPTTVGMIGFSHAAATDMAFSATAALAMVAAAAAMGLVPGRFGGAGGGPGDSGAVGPRAQAEAYATQQQGMGALAAFGFFLGLAVLAKGPAGIILCGGAVFFWALWTKRWREAFRLLHPAAIAAFCATALPWYIVCARRNADFFRMFIIEHNFKRYLTPEFQHIQPWWYYAPIAAASMLPWTAGLAMARVSRGTANEARNFESTQRLLLCFGLFPILFFTISKSKLPGYILPAVFPLGLLIAGAVSRAVSERRRERLLGLLFGATLLALAAGVSWYARRHALAADIVPAPWTRSVSYPLYFGAAAGAILALLKRTRVAVAAMQIAVLASVLGLGNGLHWLDAQISARGALRAATQFEEGHLPDRIFVYRVPRGIQYGLNFYLGRELAEWSPNEAARERTLVFVPQHDLKTVELAGFSCERAIVSPAAIACRSLQDAGEISGRGRPGEDGAGRN